MDVRDTESKKSVLAELLEQGMVLVTLDARTEGVDVPQHLADDPQLRLNLSYRFGLPMTLEEWGVHATLTFAGSPFPCRLPWAAIYLLVSHVTGRPILFPADVPSEFFPNGAGAPQVSQLGNATRRPGSRPRLQVVEGQTEGAEIEAATEAEAPVDSGQPTPSPTPPRRGHLRVVK